MVHTRWSRFGRMEREGDASTDGRSVTSEVNAGVTFDTEPVTNIGTALTKAENQNQTLGREQKRL